MSALNVISRTQIVVVDSASGRVTIISAGPSGPPGPPGTPGPPGGDLVASYIHTQSTPSASWDIDHMLGFYPNITIVDSAGDQVEGDVSYNDLNSVTVSFNGAFSGSAYLS